MKNIKIDFDGVATATVIILVVFFIANCTVAKYEKRAETTKLYIEKDYCKNQYDVWEKCK